MAYAYEGLGPFLSGLTLVFLFVVAVLGLGLVLLLAAVPGIIARRRGHRQAEAINICIYGWGGLTTIDASGAGQMTASGELPEGLDMTGPSKFAARIKLEDGSSYRLPAGIQGRAAVYTDHAQIAGIPVMFVVRVQIWLHYIF